MACILLFLEKRLRQDKAQVLCPQIFDFYPKSAPPNLTSVISASVAVLVWTANREAAIHAQAHHCAAVLLLGELGGYALLADLGVRKLNMERERLTISILVSQSGSKHLRTKASRSRKTTAMADTENNFG